MPNLLNLIRTIIKRGVITLAGKDDKDIRVQQLSANGKAVDAEVWAPYGVSYNIPPGSLCVYLQIGGDQGNLVVLPDRSQDRVKDLKSGEVAFFNPLTKSRTIYRENGDIEIVTEGTKGDLNITVKGNANITASATTVNGDMTINGDVNINGDAVVSGDIDGATVTGSTEVKTGSITLSGHRHTGSLTAPTGGVVPTGLPI